MATKVTCPYCQGGCSVEEKHLGKKMQCPRCSKVFQTPAPASTPHRPEQGPGQDFAGEKEARLAHRRRRKRAATLNALLLLGAAGLCFAAVVYYAKEKGFLSRLARREPVEKSLPPAFVGAGRGFHILADDYWRVFDDPKVTAKPAVKPATEKPDPGRERPLETEGLEVHEIKKTGPYYLVSDMGGLVPQAVNVWESPNRLGQGKEAFYLEPGEEVTVTHWVKNFGGFKVFRVLNAKKRPGPGNKMHEAGWIIGLYLRDEEGNQIR